MRYNQFNLGRKSVLIVDCGCLRLILCFWEVEAMRFKYGFLETKLQNVLVAPAVLLVIAFICIVWSGAEISRRTETLSYNALRERGNIQALLFKRSVLAQSEVLNTFAVSLSDRAAYAEGLSELIAPLKQLQREGLFEKVGFVSADGQGFFDSGVYISLEKSPLFTRTMKGESLVLKSAGKYGRKGNFIFTAPVRHSGKIIGVLLGYADESHFNNDSKLDKSGFDGYFFVADSSGDLLLESDNRQTSSGALLQGLKFDTNFLKFLSYTPSMRRSLHKTVAEDFEKKRDGYISYSIGSAGRYAVYVPSGINDWMVVSVIPKESVNGYVESISVIASFIVGIVALSAIVFIYFIYSLNRKNNAELKKEEERLRQSEELYRIVEDFTDTIIYQVDVDRDEIRFNKSYRTRFGFAPRTDTFSGVAAVIEQYVNPEDREKVRRVYKECLEPGRDGSVDFRYRMPEGQEVWIRVEFIKLSDKTGRVCRMIGRIKSIDKERKAFERLARRAENDSLTGLLNHKAFVDQAAAFLSGSKGLSALLITDVDDFKRINDTFGHIAGDETLAGMAEMLKELFAGGNALVGRLGGDEFVVLLKRVSSAQAACAEAEKLCLSAPVMKSSHAGLTFTVSVGVVVAQGPSAFEQLYKEADEALYKAKRSGKSGWKLYGSSTGADGAVPL